MVFLEFRQEPGVHSRVTAGVAISNQVSLSSFHRDVGIPVNFQEELGLGMF